QKINCFCFTEQSLKPGETRDMTVVFYIDPAMAKDPDGVDLNTITLSYTFYAQREPYRPVADSTPSGQGKSYSPGQRWPPRTPSRTTTTTSSIRAPGRRSARYRP